MLLYDLKVQLGDVRWKQGVGHIALRSFDEEGEIGMSRLVSTRRYL